MLTTQIPSKATPDIDDQVIGNADTGQSSLKTRTFSLSSILSNMLVGTLSTTAKTIVGAINELFGIVDITAYTSAEIATEIFHAQIEPIDIDTITSSDIDNLFD